MKIHTTRVMCLCVCICLNCLSSKDPLMDIYDKILFTMIWRSIAYDLIFYIRAFLNACRKKYRRARFEIETIVHLI